MDKFYVALLFLLIASCAEKDEAVQFEVAIAPITLDSDIPIRIGVVGSGIAGASFTHFINQAVPAQCNISVYEKSNRIGGRIKKDMLGGGMVEQGATLIHSSNHLLLDMMAAYDLAAANPHGGEGEAETLAIWDGEDFRLNTSQNSIRASLQMLWAYGRSLFQLEEIVKDVIPKWQGVYSNLNKGRAYSSPRELFEDIDLYDLTQQSAYDFFKKQELADDVVLEFVDCISRVNYHQDGHINAFADMVSLAGAGLDGGSLLSVEGGNDLLCRRALAAPNIDVRLNRAVTSVSAVIDTALSHVAYEIMTQSGDKDTFDVVVIACPLDLTNIVIPGHQVKRDRPYQSVHAYFVAGEIDYSYFNNVGNSPQTIFTIEDEDIPFVSVAKTSYAPDWDLPIYKIFSREQLDDALINRLFKNSKGQLHQQWQAYTVLSPMTEWPPFKIADGLYYVNAMESAVSAMETQAVAARNIANLVIDHLKTK